MNFNFPYKPIRKVELFNVVGRGTVAEVEYPEGHPHFEINDTIVIATPSGRIKFVVMGIECAVTTEANVGLLLERSKNQEIVQRCPGCGSESFVETCIGILSGLDSNMCNCVCGRRFYLYEAEG